MWYPKDTGSTRCYVGAGLRQSLTEQMWPVVPTLCQVLIDLIINVPKIRVRITLKIGKWDLDSTQIYVPLTLNNTGLNGAGPRTRELFFNKCLYCFELWLGVCRCRDWLYALMYSLLYRELGHPRIWVSIVGSGTNPPMQTKVQLSFWGVKSHAQLLGCQHL